MSDPCFFEILSGKSRLLLDKGGVFYYKHPTIFESEKTSEYIEKYTLRGENNGLESEDSLIKSAKKYGTWSDREEDEIDQLNWHIHKLENALKKHEDSDNYILEGIRSQIRESGDRIAELNAKRESLTRYSLESYVNEKANFYMFSEFLFEDENLTEPLRESDLYRAMPFFQKKYRDLSDINKNLNRCYSPSFFEMYRLSGGNALQLFDASIYSITIFQKQLLVLCHVLCNRLDNMNIPKGIMDDPVKIYEYQERNIEEEPEEMSIRSQVASAGGEENMKPENFLT